MGMLEVVSVLTFISLGLTVASLIGILIRTMRFVSGARKCRKTGFLQKIA